MAQLSSDTLPPSADVDLVTCDEDGCNEAAVYNYRWDWGAVGKVCAKHAQLLQQTSEAIKRTIALHPIARATSEPLGRDERVQLVAKHIVLEAELEEAKTRGLEVYRKNGDLQVQLNTAVVRERELKAQVADSQVKLGELQKAHDKLNLENGRLLVELERLSALEAFVAERDSAERSERGLGDSNVVDG